MQCNFDASRDYRRDIGLHYEALSDEAKAMLEKAIADGDEEMIAEFCSAKVSLPSVKQGES